MHFQELLEIVQQEPVFETSLLLAGPVDPKHIRQQLSRWVKSGKIYQLRRGLYALAPPYQKAPPHPFLVANRMVRASYASLQSALAHYGLIPEAVPVVTSVTTGRPGHRETALGVFEFQHVQSNLFFGYEPVQLTGGQRAFVARPETFYDLRGWLKEAERTMTAEGYRVGIQVSDRRPVHSAFIRFYGLPYELELSAQPGEAFSVKIEIDTQPPAGASLATTLIRRYETLHLQHHDQASLLAGKLHAVLQRPYAKGRDIYDLVWYLSDPRRPPPNLVLLRNALAQTGRPDPDATAENWREVLLERLAGLNWERIQADGRPFLERAEDSQLLTRENLERFLNINART